MKKYLFVLIILCLLGEVGCGRNNADNPLSGKNTDERVIMCLEETYPEHKFKVVESFDKSKDSGIYADENGLEFEVHNLVYDNAKHFGCYDEYLTTILERENFILKATEIVEKYSQSFVYDQDYISVDISIEDIEAKKIKMEDVATMILEVLNCVTIPEVVLPESAGGFSTNVINYYCEPTWGRLVFSFKNDESSRAVGGHICFSQKKDTPDSIKKELEEVFAQLSQDENIYSKENGNLVYETTEYEEGISIEEDYGRYILSSGWCLNEDYSTMELDMFTEEVGVVQEESSYFIVGCRTNPYTVEQHELFRESILSQLVQNDSMPEDTDINATGYQTENGNIAYSFEIVLSDNEVMTMHYIVGDKRHCLIQEVNYNNSESCSEAVQRVINTFLWKE